MWWPFLQASTQKIGLMSFIAYDIIFLVVFTLLVVLFLYTHRHNLKREGLLYLYRTKVGLRVIEWTSRKYASILKPMQYLIIASGYALMAAMLWFLASFSYNYIRSPFLAEQLRVPVLTPLIPYIDKLFTVDFLPPFYFTYWIIIIAIIAVPHEFAHGIFARLNKIRIHSTGFGFLGPFLAAFVEQNEKDMTKAKKFPQLAVLAAGTFANVLTAIIFGIIFILFTAAAFTPAGVYFNTYSAGIIDVSSINTINGVPYSEFKLDNSSSTVLKITSDNLTYFASSSLLDRAVKEGRQLVAYEDSPARRANLSGAITHINGKEINSYDILRSTIQDYRVGDNITITTTNGKLSREFNITLAEKEGRAFLGVGIIPNEPSGIRGFVYSFIKEVKDPFLYYHSDLGDFGIFIYDLLWWIIIICISVALVNMLPVGMFDGGRFFYLTVLGITGSEKAGKRAFKISTWIILLLVAALMLKWFLAIF